MRQWCFLAGTVVLCCLMALSQESEVDISRYIGMIESGQSARVREEIPSLLSRHPNNPAVIYLQALATEDGAEAVRIFQSVFDNFPRSEWADDALYKVYQFYYSLGLYRTAEIKLNQLKQSYPNSRYVRQPDQVETGALAEERQPPPQRPPEKEPEPAVGSGETSAPGRFALQVGAYTVQVNAAKQKLFFEDLGYPVDIISKVKDNRSLFTVLVGSYATYDDAKAKGVEIKKEYNIDSIVVER